MAHVASSRPHARLIDVDPSEALAMKGVVDFVSYKDVPAKNNYALMSSLKDEDETVFAKDTVTDSVFQGWKNHWFFKLEICFLFVFIVWFLMVF